MILHDLLHNGKTDSASSLGRISGNICPVKTIKNIWQILGCNSLAVILDLHLDKISHILYANLDDSPWFLHIFNGITYNIVDHTANLLAICDDLNILLHIIGIHKFNSPGLHLESQFLRTVRKIVLNIQFTECIRNTVGIDFGVKSQLIDQMIHLIGLVINSAYIPVHLLRCVRNTIHDTFHITLNCCNRSLQIMGNIADQFLVLFVHQDLLFCGFLKTFPHLLKILAKLGKFIVSFYLQYEIQITLRSFTNGTAILL